MKTPMPATTTRPTALPAGSAITMTVDGEGKWHGTLSVPDKTGGVREYAASFWVPGDLAELLVRRWGRAVCEGQTEQRGR